MQSILLTNNFQSRESRKESTEQAWICHGRVELGSKSIPASTSCGVGHPLLYDYVCNYADANFLSFLSILF